MATLGDIRDICVKDILGRTDDTRFHGLKAARNAYLSICGKVCFPELQAQSGSISVTADSPTVSISALYVAGILTVRYHDDSADTYRTLKRTSVEAIDMIPQRRSGVPAQFARGASGTTLELNPLPDDSADSIVVRYWRKPPIADPNDFDELEAHQLLIPLDWEELLQWETLYRLYHYESSAESLQRAMMLVAPSQLPAMGSTKKITSREVGIIPRLWNDLLQTLDQREAPQMDYPLAPRVRAYTRM